MLSISLMYLLLWMILETPLLALILSCHGIYSALSISKRKRKKHRKVNWRKVYGVKKQPMNEIKLVKFIGVAVIYMLLGHCSCAVTATWNKFVTRKGVPQSTNPIKWWVPIGLLHDWCFCLFIVHTTIWWLVMLFKHIISSLTVVVP